MSLSVGSIVEGVVKGITNFGAFVELPNGQTGLVHISEVADTYVKDINSYIKVNDKVKVKVLSFDETGKKIGLSIRQASPKKDDENRKRKPTVSFEDKLAKFMKDSEEKLTDLKKSTESKRGGRGAGRSFH